MNKWLLAGVFILIFLFGVLPYFAQDSSFKGDTSQISPILQTINVGAMRTDPMYGEEVVAEDGETYYNTEKGVRARDVIAEVNKQVMEQNKGKFEDEVIAIEFMLEDVDGAPVSITGVKNGTVNALISKVDYIVNVYNLNAFVSSSPDNGLKPNAQPVTSTQYSWSLFTQAGEEVEFNDRQEELPTWQPTETPKPLVGADYSEGAFKEFISNLP